MGGEAEGRLLDHGRAGGHALEDARRGVAVALGPLLDHHGGHVEQRCEARHPGDPLERLGGRLLRRDEARLGVDDDEDALLAADERH
jgi:hypothetical protein